jgi:hypothetical protein
VSDRIRDNSFMYEGAITIKRSTVTFDGARPLIKPARWIWGVRADASSKENGL